MNIINDKIKLQLYRNAHFWLVLLLIQGINEGKGV